MVDDGDIQNYQRIIILRYFMEGSISSDTHINIPQQTEIQCKICFLANAPLLRLCQCRGSIGFVHEECILKWFTLKLQTMSVLEIPRCQVCKAHYSAELKTKKDRLSLVEAFKKIREMNYCNIVVLLVTLLGAISLPYIQVVGIRNFWNGRVDNYLLWIFSFIIFPSYFLSIASGIFCRFRAQWKDCRVRQVEIYLLPKEIYR